jgi:hypothetical protein
VLEKVTKQKQPKQRRLLTRFCQFCHKFNHSSSDCWELEKNQHKRPSGWQSVMDDMKEMDYTDNTGEAKEGKEADEYVEEGTAD